MPTEIIQFHEATTILAFSPGRTVWDEGVRHNDLMNIFAETSFTDILTGFVYRVYCVRTEKPPFFYQNESPIHSLSIF